MSPRGNNPQWLMYTLRTLNAVCNGRGRPNPRLMKGHCLQLVTLCTKLATVRWCLLLASEWLIVVSGSADSGSVNDPWDHDDAIDNTAGQGLSSAPSVRCSGPATQVKVDRPSTLGEHERHEWHNSRQCYSCSDSGHWQHSMKCPNRKRITMRRPEKGFFSG